MFVHPRDRGLVLTYHRLFAESSADEIDRVQGTSVEQFEAQMDVVAQVALPVPLTQLVQRAPRAVRPLRVAVTFDDGYADIAVYALPIPRERGIPATVFTTTGFVDGSVTPWWDRLAWRARRAATPGGGQLQLYEYWVRRCTGRPVESLNCLLQRAFGQTPDCLSAGRSPFLTWEEVRRLAVNGFSFENHTHSHSYMPTLSPAEASRELRQASAAIEENAGSSPRLFAFPGGWGSLRSLRLLEREGFRAALGAGTRSALCWRYGVPTWLHRGIMMLPRKGARWTTSLDEFRAWLA